MASKPLRCRLGFHDYVRRHQEQGQRGTPERQVCRRCGRETEIGLPVSILGS
jgi:hypothetical protein